MQHVHPIHLLACPVCGKNFAQVDNALVCVQSHSFDIAREGYINLLRKKLPGDTREMLTARRAFFEHGHYLQLSDTINQLVITHIPHEPFTILDAGCGEGYYTGRLHTYLTELQHPAITIGIDVSKEAIRLAAKRYKETLFIVANLKERLVLMDHALHLILNIFAPRNPAEFARVLVPGGLLLVVIPGPAHMQQLRTTLHLLNIEDQKQVHVQEQFSVYFDLLTTYSQRYEITLRNEEIIQAVTMTPNYWHLSEETHRTMATLPQLTTTVEFHCLLFKRRLTSDDDDCP